MGKYNKRLTAVFTTIGAGVLIFFGSLWLVGSIVLSNVQNSIVFFVLFGIAFIILISTFIIFLERALKLPKEKLKPKMIKHSKKIRNSFRIVNFKFDYLIGSLIIIGLVQ